MTVAALAALAACSVSQDNPQDGDAAGGSDAEPTAEEVAAAASDEDICAAYRFLVRQGERMGGSDPNAVEDARAARLEFERAIAAAQPSVLRTRADGWLDTVTVSGRQDPTVSRIADGVHALIITEGDPSHPYYQGMLEAGYIDDEPAQALYHQALQAVEDSDISFSEVLAELDPDVNDAVANTFEMSETGAQLDNTCGLS